MFVNVNTLIVGIPARVIYNGNGNANPKQIMLDMQKMTMNGLNCDCPDCTCNKKGMSGLRDCSMSYLPKPLSGLGDGIKINFMGTLTGAVIGVAAAYCLGYDMKLSAAIGAAVGGFVLPSIYD